MMIKLPEIKVTVLGNCGQEHASFEEWQKCKDCDSMAALSNKIGKQSEVIARNQLEHDRIWNAAIEAAVNVAKNFDRMGLVDVEIRKLKK